MMLRTSALLTDSMLSYCRRTRFGLLRLRWLLPPLVRVSLPVAVTRNRACAPLCVFSFGIYLPDS